jgi:hypothetical protein
VLPEHDLADAVPLLGRAETGQVQVLDRRLHGRLDVQARPHTHVFGEHQPQRVVPVGDVGERAAHGRLLQRRLDEPAVDDEEPGRARRVRQQRAHQLPVALLGGQQVGHAPSWTAATLPIAAAISAMSCSSPRSVLWCVTTARS